ncbi:MAG: fumarylacetoacetate hydrolase family protein [Bacillota bacterium]
MNEQHLKEAAEQLYAAEKSLSTIEHLTEKYPGITIQEAYQIQLLVVEKKLEQGARIIGKKIGLTGKAMQEFMGVNEPDYGHLFDSLVGEEDVPVKMEQLIQPKIEAELAFVLKDKLKGPGVTVAEVLKATEGVMASFEIVDSRYKNWKIKIQDTIADNASTGLFILGSEIIPVSKVNLKYVGMVFERNGRVIDTAAGAAILGHPALAVAWLANKLAEYDIALNPGEIILSGALTRAYEINKGDIFTATFGGIGQVKAIFE